mmetsp:Transcript_69117/g.218635  ORF Transcript_69117/g.218635 Transcript_69117/m.218635 type:complete len:209 (+) Transcript_69117:100-726(+)
MNWLRPLELLPSPSVHHLVSRRLGDGPRGCHPLCGILEVRGHRAHRLVHLPRCCSARDGPPPCLEQLPPSQLALALGGREPRGKVRHGRLVHAPELRARLHPPAKPQGGHRRAGVDIRAGDRVGPLGVASQRGALCHRAGRVRPGPGAPLQEQRVERLGNKGREAVEEVRAPGGRDGRHHASDQRRGGERAHVPPPHERLDRERILLR